MKKKINFSDGLWNPDEWRYVTTALHPDVTPFSQDACSISNTYYDEEENKPQYISMLYKDELMANFTVSTKCSFKSYGAPIIVISDEPEVMENGTLRYGLHIEVVLYQNGINLWHIDGKNNIIDQIVREEFPVEANCIRKMTVNIDLDKNWIIVKLDGEKGRHIIPWPKLSEFKKFYAGITACEGIDSFYDFEVE